MKKEIKALGIIQMILGILTFSFGGVLNIAMLVGFGTILIIFGVHNYQVSSD